MQSLCAGCGCSPPCSAKSSKRHPRLPCQPIAIQRTSAGNPVSSAAVDVQVLVEFQAFVAWIVRFELRRGLGTSAQFCNWTSLSSSLLFLTNRRHSRSPSTADLPPDGPTRQDAGAKARFSAASCGLSIFHASRGGVCFVTLAYPEVFSFFPFLSRLRARGVELCFVTACDIGLPSWSIRDVPMLNANDAPRRQTPSVPSAVVELRTLASVSEELLRKWKP